MGLTMDLTTEYLGLTLKNPLVASAAPAATSGATMATPSSSNAACGPSTTRWR